MKNLIEGEKVFLREMEIADSDYVVKWRSDNEILKWMKKQDKITLNSHKQWFSSPKLDRVDYIICDQNTKKPIGTLNFTNIDGQVAEAGKMLGDKAYWGGGYAKEAFSLWIDFGFKFLKLEKIYIHTREDNVGNIILNQKLGFLKSEISSVNGDMNETNTFIEMYITKNEFYNESK